MKIFACSHYLALSLVSWYFLGSATPSLGETVASPQAGKTLQPIVAGNDATANDHPWMVGLTYKTTDAQALKARLFCGGTLIEAAWVMTAAHCVEKVSATDIQVIIGRNVLADTSGEILAVRQIIVNPAWRGSFEEDIALLQLVSPSSAAPVKLASPEIISALQDQQVHVYGWGNTFDEQAVDCALVLDDKGPNEERYRCETFIYQSTNIPATLQFAELTLKSAASCKQRLLDYVHAKKLAEPRPGDYFYIDEDTKGLCAWDEFEIQTACYGDSGGPLIGRHQGEDYLLGVVSRGSLGACALSYQVGFYANAARFGEFVRASQQRDPARGFDAFCPGPVDLKLSYTEGSADQYAVTARWQPLGGATAYILYYSVFGKADEPVRSKILAPTATEFSVRLPAGSHYAIAMRGTNPRCDGSLSAILELELP